MLPSPFTKNVCRELPSGELCAHNSQSAKEMGSTIIIWQDHSWPGDLSQVSQE